MTFIATFEGRASAEHLSTLQESLKILEQASRAQPGTIRYEFYQSEEEPTRFMRLGVWEDEEDWQAHVASEVHKQHVASLPVGAWTVRPAMSRWRSLGSNR